MYKINESDYGAFAISFAFHFTLRLSSDGVEFNRTKMREHLTNCILNRNVVAFPQTNLVQNSLCKFENFP